MPAKIPSQAKIAAFVALVLAGSVVTVGVVRDGDVDPSTSDAGVAIDADLSVKLTDLGTEPVPPGKLVTTEVNFEPGTTVVGAPELTGEAIGCFAVLGAGKVPNTDTYRVVAQNTCPGVHRFTANIHYQKTP